MDTIYLVLLAFLAVLAAIDLFVGVSNDAVNFLNSAVGSRIAPFKVTLAVTALGVFLGAAFSGGMMEIARTGVFHPAMFTFAEVMAIYFAVMVTDVLLLNAFNRMGLPTSTTVSIVFELLGAAAGVAIMKLVNSGESIATAGSFINSGKALGMISAILVSVVVAFIAGAAVQYVTRLIFTFHYDRLFKKLGGIYGGFALAMIFYFLVMKGAKGASFMTPEVLAFFAKYTVEIVLGIFVAASVLLQAAMMFFNTNVFRIVILAGTFALAFAFAGNDLVNFVGVPIAALDSVHIFGAADGASADTFLMGGLAQSIPAPTMLLLLSGLIMVVTLFTSKNACHVIETSVNLSSSASGEKEQFGATPPGRLVVRGAMAVSRVLHAVIPPSVFRAIDSRFVPKKLQPNEEALPFDYIRASLNLIISAILIASATSLKLPLSTTYVTFMVAMGSSFADRAWDRESAVYRVSGVITVISGWFLTAISAFTAAAVAGIVVLEGGSAASVLLMVVAMYVIVKTNFMPNPRKKAEQEKLRLANCNDVRIMLDREIPKHYDNASELFGALVAGFNTDDERALRSVLARSAECLEEVTADRALYYQMAKHRGTHDDNDAKHGYYRSYTAMREVARTLERTASLAKDHIANRHRIFPAELAAELNSLAASVDASRAAISAFCGRGDYDGAMHEFAKLEQAVNHAQEIVLTDVNRFGLSLRGSELYLMLVQFVREMVTRYEIVLMLQQGLNGLCRAQGASAIAAATGAPSAPAPKVSPAFAR